jgi:hypothetical protein
MSSKETTHSDARVISNGIGRQRIRYVRTYIHDAVRVFPRQKHFAAVLGTVVYIMNSYSTRSQHFSLCVCAP